MKSKISKYTYLFLLTILTVGLGFYRDFIFKSINALLKAWDFGIKHSPPSPITFLEKMDYSSVVKIKWFLTILCAFLFLGISIGFVRVLFHKKQYIVYTIWSYAIVTIVSFFLILLGYVFSSYNEKFYLFSRYLMGMAQSPVILMILIAAFKIAELNPKENTQSDS